MKAVLIAIGITFIANSAMAEEGKKMDSSYCPMFGDVAKTAMTKRQQNLLMSDLIVAIEKALGKDDPIAKYGKALVIQAYQSPLYLTKESKEREIVDFANKALSMCYEN